MYNKYTSDLIEKDYTTPRCNRGRVDTGTFCNYNCEFCYYQGLLHIKDTYDQIINRIDDLYSYGIKEVDLSGGESSIHKRWFDILKYCDNRFDNISTLSNGWSFSKEDFLIKSKQHGLKEILFSVHGWCESNHDKIVGRKGAWKRMMKAIDNAHEHGLIVRINCTVYQENCEGLATYHEVIKRVKPHEINFLTLNYWTNNRHAKPIDYKAVTNSIKQCIDNIKHDVKYINVRYTPFCYMQGYEKYVCNQYQHIYDIYDWNIEAYDEMFDPNKIYSDQEKIDLAHQTANSRRQRDYTKSSACLKCKHLYICDGVENEVKNFEPIPVSGEKIRDVNHYRADFYE